MLDVEVHTDVDGPRKFSEAMRQKGLKCEGTHGHIILFSLTFVFTSEQVT